MRLGVDVCQVGIFGAECQLGYGVYSRGMDHLARRWCRRALCPLTLLAVGEPGAGPPRSLGTQAADVRAITSGKVLQLLALGPVVRHCIRPRSPRRGLAIVGAVADHRS